MVSLLVDLFYVIYITEILIDNWSTERSKALTIINTKMYLISSPAPLMTETMSRTIRTCWTQRRQREIVFTLSGSGLTLVRGCYEFAFGAFAE